MMETNHAYAEALFMLSSEEGTLNEFSEALNCVHKVIEENPLYIDFLSSPATSLKERLDSIDEVFSKNMPEYVVSFIKLLCENGQVRFLNENIEEFERLKKETSNVAVAKVYSTVELTKEQTQALKAKLKKATGKNIELSCTLDKDLIGGIKVEVDGKIFDGSLKQKLRDVKEVID